MPTTEKPSADAGRGGKLSPGQRDVLKVLTRQDCRRDGALSTPEISRILSKRFDDWSRGKLVALEKRGLVERLGTTFSGGQCWTATLAGREALSREKAE